MKKLEYNVSPAATAEQVCAPTATLKQRRYLYQHGYPLKDTKNMTLAHASKLISEIIEEQMGEREEWDDDRNEWGKD